jgi:hypothetical protein
MSKIIPGHNGLESDSVNGPINVTTGLLVDGVEVVPADGVASVQTPPNDVTPIFDTYEVTSVTAPTDTPATADALRDNLEAVALAEIRTNLTDIASSLDANESNIQALATAVNAIITKLQTAGIFSA